MISTLFRLLRVEEWTKNLFVVAPLIFSRKLGNLDAVLTTVVAFGLFCLVSSAVYIFNDIRDASTDRMHPIKKNRPIASGAVSLYLADGIGVSLLAVSLSSAFFIWPEMRYFILSYALLQIAYNLVLKHLVIIDVMTISAGFLIRVLCGAAVVQVFPSNWLVICTILISLFIGFSKRRHELAVLTGDGSDHREVLSHYSEHLLDQLIGIVTAATVMSYTLYTISEETVKFFGTKNLIWTVPFVLYGVFRYLYLVHKKEMGGNPARTIFLDLPMIINMALWAASCVFIIYWRT